MNTKPSSKCKHVWIEGAVDLGLSYDYDRNTIDILSLRMNCSGFFEGMEIYDYQHCAICYLEKYTFKGEIKYNTYWQKELRLNREMVSAYYIQLRESDLPVSYFDFVPFWKEKSDLIGENYMYRNKLPKK